MRHLVIGLALGLLGLGACSSDRHPAADAGVSSDARALLAQAVRISAPDVAWRRLLTTSSFVRKEGAFSSAGHREATLGVPMAFGARVSPFADGAIDVRAGETGVSLRIRGARASEGTIEDGEIVFAGAHPATDLLIGSAPGILEAFWLLHDASAPSSFDLDLELRGLVAEESEGAILFRDDKRVARIRIPRPSAIDAAGVRREATLALHGGSITIALDRTGLVFPILLDPALEQLTWADVGQKLPSWPPPGATGPARITPIYGVQRASGRMAVGNGRVYMFGGTYVAGSYMSNASPYVTNLLEWDGATWTASANGDFTAGPLVLGDPDAGDANRVSDIAWDPVRKKLVMFGSFTFGPLSPKLGVYEYDPIAKAWSQVCPSGPGCQDTMPDPVGPPSAVYAFGKIVLVHSAGTYSWNAATQRLLKFPATPDLKRGGAALAFDVNRNRLVAYGDDSGGTETWETDGTTWTKAATVGPYTEKNTSLAYDPVRKQVFLWGSGGMYGWSGSAWSAVPVDGAGPPSRANAAFTYDTNKGKFIMHGGGDLGVSIGRAECFGYPYDSPFDSNREFRTCARVDTWTSQLFGGACALSADCEAGNTCVDGVCCQTTCGATCQRCDAPGSVGKCTTVLSAADPDTCSGDSSCDATGACKKNKGKSCAIGAECGTGNCADGYCCDTACPGSCESCNVPGSIGSCTPLTKGAAGKSCGSFTCSGTSACSTTCATDSDCSPTSFCNASSQCVPQLVKGGTCARNRQCSTGVCADGVCCNSACGGNCDVCSAALGATVDGTCTFLPKTAEVAACGAAKCSGTSAACGTTCTVDGDCSSSGSCVAGTCGAKRKKGESCDRTTECQSGLSCADGVCCNETCDGDCRACSALNKQSGDASGECGPAKEGTNPRAKCVKSAVASCSSSGLCNATGSCALYGAGTPCGPSGTTSCDMGSVKGQTCDGLGACILSSIGTPCSPGLCTDGACKDSCATDADCAAEGYCTGGTCKKKSAAGDKCGSDAQCTTNFCADGVCCNARCDGACEACDQAGTLGTCTAVTGKPRLGHPACAAADPGNPCSGAACDGVNRTTCAKKSGPEVSCRAGSCEGGTETLPAACDGSGVCPAGDTRPCQPFACGTDACKKSCTSEADCKAGFVCNTESGTCTAGDKCAGSIVTHVDGTTTDCSPYVCESSGKCKLACASTSECVAPKICSDSACVDPAAGETDSGGGCSTSRRSSSSIASLFFLAAALTAFRKRRT